MEFQSCQANLVHRISAQKSLAMPAVVSTSALDAAEADLLCGYSEAVPANYHNFRQGQRWGSKPETYLLNDYQKLMVYLFSEEFEISTQFPQAIKSAARPAPTAPRKNVLETRLLLLWTESWKR